MTIGYRINTLYKMRVVLGAQIRALRVAGKNWDALDGHLTAVIEEHQELLDELGETPIVITKVEHEEGGGYNGV